MRTSAILRPKHVAAFARSASGGLIVTASGLTFVHRDLIVTLAARHQLPAIYWDRAPAPPRCFGRRFQRCSPQCERLASFTNSPACHRGVAGADRQSGARLAAPGRRANDRGVDRLSGRRGVVSHCPKRSVRIWMFGPGRVKGSPIPDLRRQRRSGARLRGKQGRQSHLIPLRVVYGHPLTLHGSTTV
jgi:hypothetical protein